MTLTRRSTLSLAGGVAAMGLVGHLGWYGYRSEALARGPA